LWVKWRSTCLASSRPEYQSQILQNRKLNCWRKGRWAQPPQKDAQTLTSSTPRFTPTETCTGARATPRMSPGQSLI
jgi:hypothetical protein